MRGAGGSRRCCTFDRDRLAIDRRNHAETPRHSTPLKLSHVQNRSFCTWEPAHWKPTFQEEPRNRGENSESVHGGAPVQCATPLRPAREEPDRAHHRARRRCRRGRGGCGSCPLFAETCTSHSRMTVGTALSSAKCTSRRRAAPAAAVVRLAAPLPGPVAGAVCPNLLQRPGSGWDAREESLIFRASSRGRSRRGAPLQQIRTRPRPGPPQEPHSHHLAPAHPRHRVDPGPRTAASDEKCSLCVRKQLSDYAIPDLADRVRFVLQSAGGDGLQLVVQTQM